MNKKKAGINVILLPIVIIIFVIFFISFLFIGIGLLKIQERTREAQHIEKNEVIKEYLEIYIYNGSITKDGWKNSSNTNILIINLSGYDTIIDYFYILAKDGRLLIKGIINLKIEKGNNKIFSPKKLGLPNYMNDWKNFKEYVGLIVLHTINGNLFISKYEIPSKEIILSLG